MAGLVINEIRGQGVNRSWRLPDDITEEQARAIAERLKDHGRSVEKIIELALYEIKHGAPEHIPEDQIDGENIYMVDEQDGAYGEARLPGVGIDPLTAAS